MNTNNNLLPFLLHFCQPWWSIATQHVVPIWSSETDVWACVMQPSLRWSLLPLQFLHDLSRHSACVYYVYPSTKNILMCWKLNEANWYQMLLFDKYMKTDNSRTELIRIKDEDFTFFIHLTQPAAGPCLTQFAHHSEPSLTRRHVLILVLMASKIQTKMPGIVIVAS